MYEQTLSRPEASRSYTELMEDKIGELTEIFQDYFSLKAKLHWDSHLLSELISCELVILSHLLVKLKGMGDKAKPLYEKLDKFRPWLYDVTIPQVKEPGKVTVLFDLILQAYDLLGYSR